MTELPKIDFSAIPQSDQIALCELAMKKSREYYQKKNAPVQEAQSERKEPMT